jgi:hypothetical protein
MELSGNFQFTFFILAHWEQILLFIISWICFYVVGLFFLDYGIGQYHSSYLKRWVIICKALFLSTFIIACTLLELLTFEILDVIDPLIRQFIWTASFTLLCIILNVLIPGVLTATICVHFEVPHIMTGIISVSSLLIFRSMTAFLRVFLPLDETKLVESNERFHSGPAPPASTVTDLFGFNFQISISLIAIVGTVIAAVIAGFATVSFPIEQLVTPFSINDETLKERQVFLLSVVQTVVKKKKSLLLLKQKQSAVKSVTKMSSLGVPDVETGRMFTPLSSPMTMRSESSLMTPVDSPASISNSGLSLGNNNIWFSNSILHRHSGLNGLNKDASAEYTVDELSEPPSAPPTPTIMADSNQFKYVGFGKNYHHDSTESFDDVADGPISFQSAYTANAFSLSGTLSGPLSRNSTSSRFSYHVTYLRLRAWYRYAALVKWCKNGCSPMVAYKAFRGSTSSIVSRCKILVSCAYHESRSRCCSIRAKPRHTNSPFRGSKCAICANKAFCEHAKQTSWWDVLWLTINNNLLWLYYGLVRVWRSLSAGAFFVADFVSWNVCGTKLAELIADDDTFVFPTSENRQTQKLVNEISIVQKEVSRLERLSDELVLEIVSMKESLEKIALSVTYWGMMLRVSGQYLTLMGLFRFVFGMWRIGWYITAGRYFTVSQQSDNVSSFLEFVVLYLHLNIDLEPWSPILGFVYIACMTLLHIRAFFISTEQFAKLGVLSTSTEIYSLVLAYMAGAYSVAGVMFLRSQLPRYRRKAVTAALGENLVLDFYFWLFDVLFILSTLLSCCYFFIDYRRKKRLNTVISSNGGASSSNEINCRTVLHDCFKFQV